MQMIFAAMTLLKGPRLTISSLLMLQQIEGIVNSTVWQLIFESKRLSDHLRVIQNIYTLSEVENKIKDGDTPYPLPSEKEKEKLKGKGAKIELR